MIDRYIIIKSIYASTKVRMYLVNTITTTPLYEYQFAICESCFWCATIFHKAAIKQEQEEYTIRDSNNNNFQQLSDA
jgi:hypothetical protein